MQLRLFLYNFSLPIFSPRRFRFPIPSPNISGFPRVKLSFPLCSRLCDSHSTIHLFVFHNPIPSFQSLRSAHVETWKPFVLHSHLLSIKWLHREIPKHFLKLKAAEDNRVRTTCKKWSRKQTSSVDPNKARLESMGFYLAHQGPARELRFRAIFVIVCIRI